MAKSAQMTVSDEVAIEISEMSSTHNARLVVNLDNFIVLTYFSPNFPKN